MLKLPVISFFIGRLSSISSNTISAGFSKEAISLHYFRVSSPASKATNLLARVTVLSTK
jgi:hypothetical protein